MRAVSLAQVVVLLLGAGLGQAEIYQWTDDRGVTHFADSPHAVPQGQRVRTLDDRLAPPPPPATIPLEQVGGGYAVPVRIEGRDTARLVVDTGASVTVLSSAVARRLGLVVRRDPLVTLRTANGTVEAGWAQVQQIEVGGRQGGPLRVVIHDALPDLDGLLGMDFLGAFRVELRAEVPALVLSPR